MIERILPTSVAVSETLTDPPEATLFPQERELVSNAVESRRQEFTTGRHCARQALAQLDIPPAPILTGTRGAPGWPEHTVGSITHCKGYRAAVAAHTKDVTAIGIDAEPQLPLPEGVLEAVCLPAERPAIEELLRTRPELPWDRLLFSAKESVYKTWYPLTGRFLEFEEAHLVFDPDSGTFTAQLLAGAAWDGHRHREEFHGHWLAADGILLTAIALPVDAVKPDVPRP